MELESLVHSTVSSGVESSEFFETSPHPRRMGSSYPFEKFGEIYFGANRRVQTQTGRGDQYLFRSSSSSSKDYPGFPSLARGQIEKEGECYFKKFIAGTVSGINSNEQDELFPWSFEGKTLQEGVKEREVESLNHLKLNTENFDVSTLPNHDAGCKRKLLDVVKEFQDGNNINKKFKKKREKEIEDRRGSSRKEEVGGPKMPPWHIDVIEDMTVDLEGSLSNLGADLTTGSYNMSEALLSLPSLTVFKQEAPSPSHENLLNVNQSNLPSDSEKVQVQDHTTALHRLLQQNTYNNINNHNTGNINSHGPPKKTNCNTFNKHSEMNEKKTENCRFQYVLAAATSIATKVTEETLTYLNQGQSYEIKLKKVGELSNFRGKILKSIIRICFHERRLQYMEKEQIYAWQASRPGERIIELDVPLSYGLFDIEQDPNMLNMLSFLWDPTKEVGAYIKVNCISTEFTPKKHGGEKGVPFRIQVETFIEGESTRLHAAACQIKVFKLKGADRKHKQDREKILKRPLQEQDKYQPSYECTVLNDLLPEAVVSSLCCLSSPTSIGSKGNVGYGLLDSSDSNSVFNSQLRYQMNSPTRLDGSINADSNNEKSRSSMTLTPPDPNLNASIMPQKLSPEFNCQQTSQWLRKNSFGHYATTFAHFTGADILRLTRDDLIQICGVPDGIRLLYAIHSKAIVCLTLYVCIPTSPVYHAVYLDHISRNELLRKLTALLAIHQHQIQEIFLQGPNDIKVLMTDEVMHHVKDESMFSVEVLKDEIQGKFALLLKPTGPSPS